MKIVQSNAELIDRKNMSETQIIEYAGRTCYKSNDLAKYGSDIIFCEKMIKSKHLAMLEHGWVHLLIENNELIFGLHNFFSGNLKAARYFNITILPEMNNIIITGSFRAWYELFLNNMNDVYIDGLKATIGTKYAMISPFSADTTEFSGVYIITEDQIKKYINKEYSNVASNEIMKHIPHSVIITSDRGVTHELVRHRPASFAQESTRYVDYTREKNGNEITVIEPVELIGRVYKYDVWKKACEDSERAYFELRSLGCSAQEARGVLPTDLKAEIVITANEEEWQHILNLRFHGTTGAPHPHMVDVMGKVHTLLVEDSDHRLK